MPAVWAASDRFFPLVIACRAASWWAESCSASASGAISAGAGGAAGVESTAGTASKATEESATEDMRGSPEVRNVFGILTSRTSEARELLHEICNFILLSNHLLKETKKCAKMRNFGQLKCGRARLLASRVVRLGSDSAGASPRLALPVPNRTWDWGYCWSFSGIFQSVYQIAE